MARNSYLFMSAKFITLSENLFAARASRRSCNREYLIVRATGYGSVQVQASIVQGVVMSLGCLGRFVKAMKVSAKVILVNDVKEFGSVMRQEQFLASNL